MQSGKPVGVFRTHEWAPRVLIANSNLVGDWATWDEFRRLDALGLTMYGQMTAGSWIYIGTQGILQGTYQTFAAAAREALRRRPGRPAGADGRPRRHGRRPAAGGRRCAAAWRSASRSTQSGSTAASRRATSTPQTESLDEALRWADGAVQAKQAAEHRPVRQRRRRLSRAGDPRRRSRPGHRPDLGSRHAQRLRARRHELRRGARAARRRPPTSTCAAPRRAIVVHVQAMVDLQTSRRPRLRLRQQHPWRGEGGRLRRRLRLPGLRAALHPAAVLPRQRALPLGGALRRPGRHRAHRPRRAGDLPRQRDGHAAGSAWRPRRSTSRGCPVASAGSSTASGRSWARSSTTSSRAARCRRRS